LAPPHSHQHHYRIHLTMEFGANLGPTHQNHEIHLSQSLLLTNLSLCK